MILTEKRGLDIQFYITLYSYPKTLKTLFMKKIMMLAVAALLTTGAVFACDGKKDCTKCKKEEKKACGKDCKKDCKKCKKDPKTASVVKN